jgi:purine nucleosidase
MIKVLKINMMAMLALVLCISMASCSGPKNTKIKVLFDTDANNELDDQHALAYLLFNGDVFDVVGVTVNTTRNGGDIHEQYLEAERVMRLCNQFGKIPLLKGANGSFEEIRPNLNNASFDGSEAVNFIIDQSRVAGKEKLVLLPVGKLTNIALALEKEPSIANKVRIVWLGSNYPKPGEYNQDNDIASMNYILSLNVPFEIVTVRYNDPSGTDAVRATPEEINQRMPGIGPKISEPVIGRHSGEFYNFGDYSVNLFKHIDLHGNPPSRALFDMAAVAIVKNPAWAEVKEIPAPVYVDRKWLEQPDNQRKIKVWENFDRNAIMEDFYSTMQNYVLVKP